MRMIMTYSFSRGKYLGKGCWILDGQNLCIFDDYIKKTDDKFLKQLLSFHIKDCEVDNYVIGLLRSTQCIGFEIRIKNGKGIARAYGY